MTSSEQPPKSPLPSLVLAGQFPPPVHGFAYITKEISKALIIKHNTTIIDLVPHVLYNGVPYHLRRLLLTLKGLRHLLCKSIIKKRKFYIACEGGLGIIYTIILCIMARALKFPIYIHHHSFAYIENTSRLMAILLRVIGHQAIHIFLCPMMSQHFMRRYQRNIKCLFIPNSAFVDEVSTMPPIFQKKNPLKIGLLSNLNDEKGLSIFLDIIRFAAFERLDIIGILAGPPVSESDKEKITITKKELGERLDYRGPVYGNAKEAFFRSIDVFVFPTRYLNEAQPTVIFEAMAHGIPILSYDRGCIKEQISDCGAVLDRENDFISFALDWLKKQLNSPETLNELKRITKMAFLDNRTQAKQIVDRLFDLDPKSVRPSFH